MNVLIATDSFKDGLNAGAVCDAIAKGLTMADAGIQSVLLPLADGGEGTLEVFLHHLNAKLYTIEVHDPLFRPIEASYAISADGKTAFIEMARASGLERLLPSERNPMITSSFGTGELIKDAIERGVQKILLAIGGSATNDGGIGIAAALGYLFLDDRGAVLQPIGENLQHISKIDGSQCNCRVALQSRKVHVEVLCDVNNPLYGENGAACIYAAQKGATEAMVASLDNGLRHYAQILERQFQKDYSEIEGTGAAGGTGAGALAFLNADLRAGVDVLMELATVETHLSKCDLVITGEGRLDEQTTAGKLIKGLTRKANQHSIPVIAICGTLEASPLSIQKMGLSAAFSILNAPMPLPEALLKTADLLTETAFHLGKVLTLK